MICGCSFLTRYNLSLTNFVPNFRIVTQAVAEKSICIIEECKREKWKKNEKEDKMRISILISIYTVHFPFLKVYTKFENTGSNRS